MAAGRVANPHYGVLHHGAERGLVLDEVSVVVVFFPGRPQAE